MRYIQKVMIEHVISNRDIDRWLNYVHNEQIRSVIEACIRTHAVPAKNIQPLLDYIDTERISMDGIEPMHPDFESMKSHLKAMKKLEILRKQLRQEQYGLCCFCQEPLGSTDLIEHFLPQSLYKNEEVDYYNFFISCTKTGQCSHKKGEEIIPKFLTHPGCEDFFKYNWFGEILPNHQKIGGWNDCSKEELMLLDAIQLQAYATIKILGLNNPGLVARRKTKLEEDDLRRNLLNNKKSFGWLKQQQCKYKPTTTTTLLPDFAPMFLYFINETIERHHGRQYI